MSDQSKAPRSHQSTKDKDKDPDVLSERENVATHTTIPVGEQEKLQEKKKHPPDTNTTTSRSRRAKRKLRDCAQAQGKAHMYHHTQGELTYLGFPISPEHMDEDEQVRQRYARNQQEVPYEYTEEAEQVRRRYGMTQQETQEELEYDIRECRELRPLKIKRIQTLKELRLESETHWPDPPTDDHPNIDPFHKLATQIRESKTY
jgi:hypothetical protein